MDHLAYSGASVANTRADTAAIVRFDFIAPTLGSGANHDRLLAMVYSAEDPISPASAATLVVDTITPHDNNMTHRNYRTPGEQESQLDSTPESSKSWPRKGVDDSPVSRSPGVRVRPVRFGSFKKAGSAIPKSWEA